MISPTSYQKKAFPWIFALVLGAAILSFQNCSQVNFADVDGAGGLSKSEMMGDLEVVLDPTPTPFPDTANEVLPPADPIQDPVIDPVVDPIDEPKEPVAEIEPGKGHSTLPEKEPSKDPEHQAQQREDACRDLEIADVVVHVKSINIASAQLSLAGSGDLSLLSLKDGFKFMAPETISTQQVRLVLADEGNKIIDVNDRELALKTPSAQHSGLKILLRDKAEFKAGQAYLLKVDFSASTQIVDAGEKCLLKPVLRATEVVPVE